MTEGRGKPGLVVAALVVVGAAIWGLSRWSGDARAPHAQGSVGRADGGAALGDRAPGRPDATAAGTARRGERPLDEGELGQDESTPSGVDGSVPLGPEVDRPYESPPVTEQITPEELRRRRLSQIALIDERIHELDQQMASPRGDAIRNILEVRRRHLVERRDELMQTMLEEAAPSPGAP